MQDTLQNPCQIDESPEKRELAHTRWIVNVS